MGHRAAHLTIALLAFVALATTAWAGTAGPIAKGTYDSRSPDLSVYVEKPATSVQLYIGCGSASVREYWDSPKLRLRNNAFSFDRKTKISTENGATFGRVKGTVLFNGKFSRGAFRGSAQIVGSACPKRKYTAKFNKNGGGSGK